MIRGFTIYKRKYIKIFICLVWIFGIGIFLIEGPKHAEMVHIVETAEDLSSSLTASAQENEIDGNVKNGGEITKEPVENERYLVFECGLSKSPCNGWGNRIAGIFNAYIFSVISGRTFRIHLKEPCDLLKYFLPNKINWYRSFPRQVDALYNGASIQELEQTERNQLYKDLFNKSRTVISAKFYTYHSVFYLKHNVRFRQLFIEKGFEEAKIERMTLFNLPFKNNIFETLFKLTPEMQYEMSKFLNKSRKLICAHVRIGNEGEKLTPYHIQVRQNLDVIGKFIQKQSEKDEYKTANIFIASDSSTAVAKLSHYIKKPLLTSSGSIVNIKRIKVNGTTPSVEDACDGLRKVIMDWYILSECNCVIRAPGSTFSGTAMIRNKFDKVYKFVIRGNKPQVLPDDLFL